MLLELLQRWSELEPDRCSRRVLVGGLHVLVGAGHWAEILQSETDWKDYAATQVAVQKAIIAHGLRFSLMNASDGIHAALVQFESSTIQWRAQTKHDETAIALLTVYLQWLERQEATA